MDEKPSANGDNGRDAKGRFTNGNLGGPGNRRPDALARSLGYGDDDDDD